MRSSRPLILWHYLSESLFPVRLKLSLESLFTFLEIILAYLVKIVILFWFNKKMYDRVQIIIIIIMLELIIALEIFVCRVSELMPSIFTFMQ